MNIPKLNRSQREDVTALEFRVEARILTDLESGKNGLREVWMILEDEDISQSTAAS